MMSSSSVIAGLGKGDTGIRTMEGLPSDVLLDILSRVPVESVLDCKLVCKSLLRLLRDQWNQFAKIHSQRQLQQLSSYGDASSSTGLLFAYQEDRTIGPQLYYGDNYNSEMNIHENFSHKTLQNTGVSFPPPKVDNDVIVGSSNGLICLCKDHNGILDPIHICNPNTGEYVNLPRYTFAQNAEWSNYRAAYGFGYVRSATNYQYKVVRIYYRYVDHDNHYKTGEVQVYTIGSGSGWRTIGTTSYMLYMPWPLGIFANGALHWIVNSELVAFNLADENFRTIQLPPSFDPLENFFHLGQVLRGNLCLCVQRNEECILDIWSLEKNATEASWSKDYSIPFDSLLKDMDEDSELVPILVTKENHVLFMDSNALYCYDAETATVRKIWDDKKSRWFIASPHMNSFVSLKALGEKSEIKKKVVRRSLEDTDQSV